MPFLRDLKVSHNNLSSVDVNFCKKATILRYLDLSNNYLTLNRRNDVYWAKDLINCDRVNNLILNNNKITQLPYLESNGLENELPKRIIELEENNIKEINVRQV